MAVRPYRPADLPDLHELFNEVTEPLCHGFASTADEFCSAFRANPPHLRHCAVLVAETVGRLTGFARVGIFSPVPDRHTVSSAGDGLILGPFFGPPHAAEGAALLSACLAYLRDRDALAVAAFDPVESVAVPFFNGGWSGLSERLTHIVGLYARSGFRVCGRELCLTRAPLPVPPAAEPDPPLAVTDQGLGRSRFVTRVHAGAAEAGNCYYSRMHPSRSGQPEAQEWGYIDGLGVGEPFRGRGLGRFLMAQALGRLREMGCGPVCLTTGGENYRAQNLYYSLDFALMDSCVTMVRSGR